MPQLTLFGTPVPAPPPKSVPPPKSQVGTDAATSAEATASAEPCGKQKRQRKPKGDAAEVAPRKRQRTPTGDAAEAPQTAASSNTMPAAPASINMPVGDALLVAPVSSIMPVVEASPVAPAISVASDDGASLAAMLESEERPETIEELILANTEAAVGPDQSEPLVRIDPGEPLVRGNTAIVVPTKGKILNRNPDLDINRYDPYCTKCGNTVDPMRPGVKVVGKSPPQFCCSKCNSKTVMLASLFGQWPLPQFRGLDAETQRRFWLQTANDKESLKGAIEKTLVKNMVETRLNKEFGEYLPPSVWKNRGFDEQLIMQTGKYKWSDQLGDTWAIKIFSEEHSNLEQQVQSEMLKLMGKVKKKGNRAIADGTVEAGGEAVEDGEPAEETAKPAAIEDGDAEGDDSDDSTSSSSSSSSSSEKGKKKKKGKKDKKHDKKKKAKKAEKKDKKKKEKDARKKKDKEKEESARAKKEEAAQRLADKSEKTRIAKVQTDCSKTLGKISGILLQLQELAKDKKISMVPVALSTKLTQMISSLVEYDKEAKAKLKAKCPLDLSFNMDDVLGMCKDSAPQPKRTGANITTIAIKQCVSHGLSHC